MVHVGIPKFYEVCAHFKVKIANKGQRWPCIRAYCNIFSNFGVEKHCFRPIDNCHHAHQAVFEF